MNGDVPEQAKEQAKEPEQADPGSDELKRLRREIARLAEGMQKHGAVPNIGALQSAAESYAIARILVLKGICTENEMQAAVLQAMRGMMAAALQGIEEQALEAKKPKVQPIRNPNLIVARH